MDTSVGIFELVLFDLDQASQVAPGISYNKDVQCFANEILIHLGRSKHKKVLGTMVREGVYDEKLFYKYCFDAQEVNFVV